MVRWWVWKCFIILLENITTKRETNVREMQCHGELREREREAMRMIQVTSAMVCLLLACTIICVQMLEMRRCMNCRFYN